MNANRTARPAAAKRGRFSLSRGRSWLPLAFAISLVGVGMVGCSKAPTAAAKQEAERYPLTGEILRVDQERKLLVVRHDEIKDYMPAMTMEFAASPGDIAVAQPGQRIRAELVPAKEGGDFRLEKIWPADAPSADRIALAERRLAEDTHNRGKGAYREVGENLPDFALYDHTGKVVESARFRGRQVMLNFIFTRCPDPSMCPAATIKMMTTQKLAREAGVKNLELVSITLDPEFDTPGVLRDYADKRGIDTSNFWFLTGPEKAIRNLLIQFGVIAEFEGDLLRHTLTTLLVDENGKILHSTTGRAWEPADYVAKMKK
jgi:protein SCO1